VVEESVVDPAEGTMVTRTKNLNHQKQMTVEEIQIYSKSSENSTWYNPFIFRPIFSGL
jgi:hypothetical protein